MIKIRQGKTKQDKQRRLKFTLNLLNISNKTKKDKQDRHFRGLLSFFLRAKKSRHYWGMHPDNGDLCLKMLIFLPLFSNSPCQKTFYFLLIIITGRRAFAAQHPVEHGFMRV